MYANSNSGNWETVLLTCRREGDRKSGFGKIKNAAKISLGTCHQVMEIRDTLCFHT